ncbi:hypothetical protein [Verrucosispora sp. NA02020]|uniref:hypothetical protein n=1 Tax=Verrucosispora sp. NA02020 TaxID=2742132 RepID=UPI00159056E7|nr:hypothetical protein [Verrucosispora sp. NA02020]QKW13575.1 hypothetical protein HUT12_12810 [Verrucosispora sp. NA02020]
MTTVVVVHSVTRLEAPAAGVIAVTGSHGGLFAAVTAARHRVAAAVFNDAGLGRDRAGVSGLAWLDRYAVPGIAVSHLSAPIGDGQAVLDTGVVSVVNETAAAHGCRPGQPARVAVSMEFAAPSDLDFADDVEEARHTLAPDVVGLDSVSLVTPADRDLVVVTGSHGALLGGVPASAVKVDVRAAVFNDAGGGPDGRGTTRLPALAARGIPAVTVGADTARIGDARSTYADGIVTVVNEPAAAAGIRPGMTVPQVVSRVRRHTPKEAS